MRKKVNDNFELDLNEAAVSELLKQTIVPALESMGQSIAQAAGPGHEVETFIGRRRARVTVRTATHEARRAEATDRALTRAVDAGRR